MRSLQRVVPVFAAFVLAACGGGSNSSDATSPPGTTSPPGAETAADTGDGPDATVAPNLPDELRPAVGPVQVIGEPLPPLETEVVADDVAVGRAAPVLIGENFAGETVRVDPTGPTMVVFLAHWCPHCNAEVPRLNELRDANRFPADLDIVAVSTAPDPGRPNFPPSDWITDIDWTYPVMADGVDMVLQRFIAADAYGVSGFPFVVLLNADGTVAARWSGEHETDEIIDLIESNLTG